MSSVQQPRYNWHDIVYFLEVARQRSLVRAAAKLRVDHTTVSRRIRELERSLNTALFTRSKAGFRLTETGLRLLRHAEGMESHAESISEAIGLDDGGPGGAVRIASMEGIGSLYLTRCVGAFSALYPAIQIELITDTRLLDLSRREADIFVSFYKPTGRRLSVRKAGEFKVSLFAGRRYFDARPRPRTVGDLDEHVFVDFIDELVLVNENRWLSDIVRPRTVPFRSTSLMAQCVCAAEGRGIAMLPSFVAAHHPDLVPVLPELFTTRDIWISVHEDLLHVARIKLLLGYLDRRIAGDRTFLMPPLHRAAE
ncbi:LysR family transcriptional regulator [Azospirillum halopraeferens]|uniref:LysR family transcriptional regulator n=1 Tax=Azospirillum halopraeferens TaxID=34010 RepID=UPI0003FE2595|nr:LysR family transcriptional regulator [Azospirillum halopraeferens]